MPDITLLLLGGLLVVMIFFTWRNSKKRKIEAEEMQSKMLPGAEVMTQHGIFGTLVSIDDDTNEAVIESTPGTLIRVHRQTLSRVVEPELALDESDDADAEAITESSEVEAPSGSNGEGADAAAEHDEPEHGERTEKPKRAPRKKPTETE